MISECNDRKLPDDWMLEEEVRVNELKQKMEEITLAHVREIAKEYNFSYKNII